MDKTQKSRAHTDTTSRQSSGYQDSNLGPPAPKAGALTGLRYIPNGLIAVQRYERKLEYTTPRGENIL